jgi:hypothetical protein
MVFTFGLTTVAAAADAVSLQINGKTLPVEVPPVIKSGRTLVPVKAISESLGADVIWDAKAKTVTIVKNSDTIILTINASDVRKNGNALNKLEVPAQIVNGRTMVPVRFVSETLGAEVDWDGATRTVKVTFTEKKADMTPEELLEKSTVAMMAYDSYKFNATGSIKVNVPKSPALNMNMTMEGDFKKPAEIYMKQSMEPVGQNLPQEKIAMEMYSVNGTVYSRINNGKWQSMNLGFSEELMEKMQNQDPAAAIEQMKQFGLVVTHANEAKKDGKDYFVLYVKIDQEKYKESVREILASVDFPAGEARELINEMFDGMKMDLSYRAYINKDTLLLEQIKYSGTMTFEVLGEKMTQDIDLEMAMYDFGAPVTMPDVTK